jgi:hypothetical protein
MLPPGKMGLELVAHDPWDESPSETSGGIFIQRFAGAGTRQMYNYFRQMLSKEI